MINYGLHRIIQVNCSLNTFKKDNLGQLRVNFLKDTFETFDHAVYKLEKPFRLDKQHLFKKWCYYGITGTVLKQFDNFFNGKQVTIIDLSISNESGMLQGCVLGPLLFRSVRK